MKRNKLRLHRDTVRNLEDSEVRDAQGGAATGVVTCIPSIVRTGCSCVVSCGGTCQATCFTCFAIC